MVDIVVTICLFIYKESDPRMGMFLSAVLIVVTIYLFIYKESYPRIGMFLSAALIGPLLQYMQFQTTKIMNIIQDLTEI
jgi:hypothetical protein